MAEDAATTVVNVLTGDTDPDGDALDITAVTQGAKGAVVITGGGTGLTYDPATNATGADSFTYTVSDGNGGTDIGTVTVTITPANDPPVADNDTLTVAEDAGPTVVNVLAGDSDPEGDPLDISAVTQGAKGAVVITGGGSGLTYDPATNATGADSFTYTVSDGNGGTDIGTVTVTITPANDPPVADNDTLTVAEDAGPTVVNVLAGDSDPEGDPLDISAVTQGAKGAVVITGGGSGLTYDPATNATGADTFTYTVSDGNGGTDIGTVTVTITPANDPPVADNDTLTVAEDAGPTVVNVLAGDSDPEGDPLDISAVTQGAKGAVVITGGGSGLTYDPATNATGADSFTYTVSDGNGGTDIGTVTVTITPANDPPVADNDSATINEDAPATSVAVLTGDVDVDGDLLEITVKTNGTKGTVVITGGGTGLTYEPDPNVNGADSFTYTIADPTGASDTATVTMTITPVNDAPVADNETLTVLEDATATAVAVLSGDTDVEGDPLLVSAKTNGTKGVVTITGGGSGLTYDPNPNATGADIFTYTVSDGNGGTDIGTVTVTITPVNDAPVADNETLTVLEDTAPTAVAVLTGDTDIDGDALTITDTTEGARGAVSITGGGTGLTYEPDPNVNGADSFTYTVSDPSGATDTATVTVTITPVNDAPVADIDTATLTEDAAATAIGVLVGDTDIEGDTLQITATTDGAKGTVAITGGGSGLTYDPNPNATGADSFTYTISDGNGGTDVGTVSMTITPVNDAPVADDEAFTFAEDVPATPLALLVGDTDVDGDALVIVSTSNPPKGSVTITGGGSGLTYQADPNATGADSFAYRISDGAGGTDVAMVSITLTPVNDAPVADNEAITVLEDSAATTVSVLIGDSDVEGDPITITAKTNGAKGAVAVTGGGTTVTYKPYAGYSGPDAFTYTISDGLGGTDVGTVSVTITGVNDVPNAVNDGSMVVPEGAPATALAVLANDTDADGDILKITAVTSGTLGVVRITGGGSGLTYDPAPLKSGIDSFTYTISDGRGGKDTAVVLVKVTPDTAPPAITGLTQTILAQTLGFAGQDPPGLDRR